MKAWFACALFFTAAALFGIVELILGEKEDDASTPGTSRS
jgi:hypothetical protein